MPVLRLLLALVLLAGPALADTNSDVRAHFKKGQMHYALGEFPEAISEFREAFRLKQEPAILFNLAQTYRQLHEWQHAYFHYRQYLIAKPNAPNRAEVEEFIEQMKNRMDEEDRAARADFNQRADGQRQSPAAAAQNTAAGNPAAENTPHAVPATPAAAVAQAPQGAVEQPRAAAVTSAASTVQPEPVASEARSARDAPPSSTVSASTDAASPPAPSPEAGSERSASPPDAAPAVVATQAAPVVLTPQPGAAAAQKPEFVDPSPGPLVVEKHTSAWRYTGYAMIGIGLVAGGVAYAMHSSAQSAADQFNGKYQASALTAADTKLRDDSESKGKLATESLFAGIALVAAGGALTIAF